MQIPARALAQSALMLALLAGGCGRGSDGRRDPASQTASASARATPPPPPARVLVDLIQALPGCHIEHRGPLLDAGTDAMIGRYGWGQGAPAGITSAEH